MSKHVNRDVRKGWRWVARGGVALMGCLAVYWAYPEVMQSSVRTEESTEVPVVDQTEAHEIITVGTAGRAARQDKDERRPREYRDEGQMLMSRFISLGREDKILLGRVARLVDIAVPELYRVVEQPERIALLRKTYSDTQEIVTRTKAPVSKLQNEIHRRRFQDGPFEEIDVGGRMTEENQPVPQFDGQLVSWGSYRNDEGRVITRVIRINPGEDSDLDEVAGAWRLAVQAQVNTLRSLIQQFAASGASK